SLNVSDVVVLCLLAELAQAHVFDHAAAKRTDGRLAHLSAPGLEVRLQIPSSSSQGTSDSVNRACLLPQRCWPIAAGYRVSGFVRWHTYQFAALRRSFLVTEALAPSRPGVRDACS